MMQIGFPNPAHHLSQFQVKGASFRCNGSPMNTLTRTPGFQSQVVRASAVQSTTEVTRQHLSSLEKLLYKEPESDSIPRNPEPVVVKEKSQDNSSDNKGRWLLEGLNLNRIWPDMKAAEEMSPRHLKRLQRLLSLSSQEYSPRNSLRSRWREYHGCNDWAGLLDPLDENLRREVVRYGEFIQAAYHGFNIDPAMSPDEPPSPRHVALSDRSYRVTKSLYATSSIALPKCVDDMAPWMTQRSSWIGYVAVCDDRREIQRMGRRDIVIALRGTATCLEWAENLRDVLVQMPGEKENNSSNNSTQTKVECGFLSLYKTPGDHVPSLAKSVVEEIQRLIEEYKGETLSITVTGHSLGAALALLVANDISTCAPDVPPVAVISFGGPRVGNRGFADQINSNNVKVLRVVNSQDVITKVPGMFVSEELDKKLRDSGAGPVLNAIDNSMPWAYSHVGAELRVDTKMSPFLKPNADVACCHDLEAYLHLVDGFLSSNCPFRSNAKRSLVKLLNEQSSNVKRLYTSRASHLSRLNLERDHLSMSGALPSPS